MRSAVIRKLLWAAFIAVFIANVVLGLYGCASAKMPIAPAPVNDLERPASTPQDQPREDASAADRIRAADQRVAKIEGDLREARLVATHEREAKDQEHRDGIKRTVDWACAVAALIGIVGAGVAVFMRSTTLALVPIAAVVMIAVGQTTNMVVDHPWLTAAGIGIIAAIIAAVPALRHRALSLEKAVVR